MFHITKRALTVRKQPFFPTTFQSAFHGVELPVRMSVRSFALEQDVCHSGLPDRGVAEAS